MKLGAGGPDEQMRVIHVEERRESEFVRDGEWKHLKLSFWKNPLS